MTLLQLQDVTYRYKNTAEAVLYQIKYNFEPGKFYSIIGESGAGALILVLSLWLRERVYEVGILLALGKGKSSIFLQFCLEVVLVSLGALLPSFIAGNAITSYLLQTVLASGDQTSLQDTLAKASGLSTSLLSFAESYVFLLLIGCLSVALCFLFLFRKSPKEILSSIS